ncbi:ATP-dependent RNA helicase RhlE [Catenovulum agarivorans DS-2]|uniref:DEAD-box ATP-dependent RNA helicase RhpA n=1 Tax=Catenovulum agarivorans DS-2 TaxID=1328313 RepID=W7QJY6_9ALTE|nr:ATP-dependent RNA helicase RhlE [Catenovulum agarivorans DS-2]
MTDQISFAELKLAEPILRAIDAKGYTTASPIQQKAIPFIMAGKNVMAAAQTGTGKTAGFTLPILHKLLTSNKSTKQAGNQVRCLILTPTRELAAQVADNVATYAQFTKIKSVVVFGGVKINPQMQKLRGGADILIATPGRLLDLYQQNALKFDDLEVLVLDEADRMLDMGFVRDIEKIVKLLPAQRQNLLFSATFSADIRQLAKQVIGPATEVSVNTENSTTHLVEQSLYSVDKNNKTALLIKLIEQQKWTQAIVFTRTKHGANRVARKLTQQMINAAAIHGDKSQGQRTKALAGFKAGEIRILVATDIAARGLDIHQLPQVVNFDLPHVAEDYVHRIGRTGRAGATGHAVSLVCADEIDQLIAIERLIGKKIKRFEHPKLPAQNLLPETPEDPKPLKAKKPKKPKKAKAQNETEQGQSRANSGENRRKAKPKTDNARRGKAEQKNKTSDKTSARSAGQKRANNSTRANNNADSFVGRKRVKQTDAQSHSADPYAKSLADKPQTSSSAENNSNGKRRPSGRRFSIKQGD